ncbi:unnamed protein product [Meganyctiphanes norvegica]|uniref:Uncharacterized protein n=1 Tax=Meganyctiphanes norvegica TaxID=48144 RepID=A0AAV2S1L9_MEGNR
MIYSKSGLLLAMWLLISFRGVTSEASANILNVILINQLEIKKTLREQAEKSEQETVANKQEVNMLKQHQTHMVQEMLDLAKKMIEIEEMVEKIQQNEKCVKSKVAKPSSPTRSRNWARISVNRNP